MGDPDDGDEDQVIPDHVDHAVVSDAKPHRSLWVPGQRPSPGPATIQAKLGHRSEDTTGDGLVELSQFPKCLTSPFDLVTHRSGDAVLGQHLTVGNTLLRTREGRVGSTSPLTAQQSSLWAALVDDVGATDVEHFSDLDVEVRDYVAGVTDADLDDRGEVCRVVSARRG